MEVKPLMYYDEKLNYYKKNNIADVAGFFPFLAYYLNKKKEKFYRFWFGEVDVNMEPITGSFEGQKRKKLYSCTINFYLHGYCGSIVLYTKRECEDFLRLVEKVTSKKGIYNLSRNIGINNRQKEILTIYLNQLLEKDWYYINEKEYD